MAREPEKGKVKTRLRGYLSDDECLRFYRALVRDTLALARKVECDERVLAYATSGHEAVFLQRAGSLFRLFRQQGRGLGERIFHAFENTTVPIANVVMIGADAPHLPVEIIEQAFRALQRYDAVLGPSRDGGFYLLGLKVVSSDIFRNVDWGSASVFASMTYNLAQHGLKLKVLRKWYDIDTPQDVRRLKQFLVKGRDQGRLYFIRQFFNLKFVGPEPFR